MPDSQGNLEIGKSSLDLINPTKLWVYSQRQKPQIVHEVTSQEHGQSSNPGQDLELITKNDDLVENTSELDPKE